MLSLFQGYIEIATGDDVSHVRLLGMNNNLYICFRSDGEIYGEVSKILFQSASKNGIINIYFFHKFFQKLFFFQSDPSNRGTIFVEEFQASYSAYKSALYPEWYIGIKNNGLPKKGYKTKYGQKAVKFLPRRL